MMFGIKVFIKHVIKQKFFSFYKNIYKTNFKKNVLISYITSPLYKGIKTSHSNFLELKTITENFKELILNVDVTDYTYEGNIDYGKYDVIFGFGSPFGKSFYANNKSIKICYLTGAMNLFDQMKRIKYLRQRKGIPVIPRRHYHYKYLQESISMSDAIILCGNNCTEDTIMPYNERIYRVRVPVFTDIIPDLDLEKKDFQSTKKHFLWFGSSGAVHKGLDLLLDVFSKNPGIHLHICGLSQSETDFIELYGKELFETPNIHAYGFLDISSEKFKNLLNRCAFIIFPSCSEGQSTSVIVCMAGGLIPVLTKETGVDIEDFGFLLESYKIEYIEVIVKQLSEFPNDELCNRAIRAKKFARGKHNPNAYKDDLKKSLLSIIK